MSRILFIADGRSSIALNWIEYWTARGDEVHLVSTFESNPALPLAGQNFVPVALSSTKRAAESASGKKSLLWGATLLNARVTARQWLGPLTIPGAARRLAAIIQRIQPDLVHAMRIPYEGMLAAEAMRRLKKRPPLLVSVWGNDFTLHARSSPLVAFFTRRAMQQTDALHADCVRDVGLAKQYGFNRTKPAIVLPGNGGINRTVFFPSRQRSDLPPTIINPRGFRRYVRNDVFFKAIPLVLEKIPQAQFLCPTMQGETQAEKWIKTLGIAQATTLLPSMPRTELAKLFQQSHVVVSPSTHDGTPNSLIEAIACGCFPIAGDIESIREWISHGENGLLHNPADVQALASAIIRAVQEESFRANAQTINQAMIDQRAEFNHCMQRAENFYQTIMGS